MIVGALAGIVVSSLSRPVYTATATSYVSSRTSTTLADHGQGDPFTQQVQQSYASIATTPLVVNPVISVLGLRTTAGELAKRVHAENVGDTVTIRISATDGSATRAAAIANAVQSELARRVQALTPTIGGAAQTRLTPVRIAQIPGSHSSPNLLLDVAIGALAGAAAWLLALLVRTIRRFRPLPSGWMAAASML